MNESTWQAQLLSLVNNLWYVALSGSFHRRCKAEGRVGAAGLRPPLPSDSEFELLAYFPRVTSDVVESTSIKIASPVCSLMNCQ